MVAVVPASSEHGDASELSKTAVLLSQVIEREAKRTSRKLRVQTSWSSFKRNSRSSGGEASDWSAKRSAVVGPAPRNEVLSGARPSTAKNARRGPSGQLATGSKHIDLERQGSKVAELRRQGSRAARSFVESNVNDGRSAAATSTAAVTTLGQRLWLLVDEPQSSRAANYISVCVFGFVLLSTVVFIAQTEASLASYASELHIVEVVCAAVFSLELTVRTITCPSKIVYFKDFANWIDILAIFPFYLEQILAVENASSFGAIRIVRLTRVARVLKISRYSSAIQVFVQAIVVSIKALSMLIFLMSIAMIVFSSLVYFSEYTSDGCRAGGWVGDCASAGVELHFASSVAGAAAARAASSSDCICVDPNPYTSIASSFWWCVVTMSTVGYGDMTPVTLPGKVVGCVTMLTGTLVLALPISVIGTNFQKVMKTMMQQTMKSNVDFLKGKRMLCRNEIEAILQRFHAVTEDIQLDVDDVINVYDEDNTGMLEDEEIQKFRIDLEILQNRLLLSQNTGAGTAPAPGGADATRSLKEDTALPLTTTAALRRQPQFNPVPLPGPRRASVSSASVRPLLGSHAPAAQGRSEEPLTPRRRAASAISSSDAVASFSSSCSCLPLRAQVFQSSRAESSQANSELLPSAPPLSATATASATELRKTTSPDLPGVLSDADSRHNSSHRDRSSPRRHSHQRQPGADADKTTASLTTLNAPASTTSLAAVDSELFWMRMLNMQHAWEERLQETEQRLEAKLQTLTKILVRLEGRMEDGD